MTKAAAQGKAFDTSYNSIPVFFPDELRIIGGADLADKRERGPRQGLDRHVSMPRNAVLLLARGSVVEDGLTVLGKDQPFPARRASPGCHGGR